MNKAGIVQRRNKAVAVIMVTSSYNFGIFIKYSFRKMKKPANEKLIYLLTVSHIARHFVLRDDDIFSNGRIFLFCRIVSFVCHFNKKNFVQMNEKPFKDGGTWCGRWYPGFTALLIGGEFSSQGTLQGRQYNTHQWRERWTLS